MVAGTKIKSLLACRCPERRMYIHGRQVPFGSAAFIVLKLHKVPTRGTILNGIELRPTRLRVFDDAKPCTGLPPKTHVHRVYICTYVHTHISSVYVRMCVHRDRSLLKFKRNKGSGEYPSRDFHAPLARATTFFFLRRRKS